MSRLADIARVVDSVGAALSIGGRTLLSLDTNPVPAQWDHITKVDPEEDKRLPLAFPLYLSHTSAVSVGGSRDVTDDNTVETFDLVNAAGVPAFHEPSEASHVTERTRDRAAFMAVPEVLNGDSDSLVGTLGKGIEHVRESVAPALIAEKLPVPLGETVERRLSAFAASWMVHEAVFEAYIIMNVDSAAAREANVTDSDLLTPEEATQHALAAETHLESEVVYLEYSGTFGGDEAVDILEAVSEGISWSRLWYGGGLDSRENARRVLEAGADAIVVGDAFHEVAEEEADLCRAAAADLDPDADTERIREWVTDSVDPAETSAAQYLSTIVDVPRPEDRAVRYLATGVEIYLRLAGLAADLSDPSVATIRQRLEGSAPGEAAFADVLSSGDAGDVASSLAVALLAERFDLDADGFAPHHVAATL